MLRYTSTGAVLGASECFISEHKICLKTNTGIMLWRDDKPEQLCFVNPENHTYLMSNVSELGSENRGGQHNIYWQPGMKGVPVTLPGGIKAVELTITNAPYRRRKAYVSKIITVSDAKIPPLMLKSWAKLFYYDPAFGYVVQIINNNPPKREVKTVSDFEREWRRVLTFGSLKKLPLDPKLFELPKKYKLVTDKTALIFSENGDMKSSDLDEFFRYDDYKKK